MDKVEPGVRYLLAVALTIFGADKFLHFMPQPQPPEEGGAFIGALVGAGYIFPIIGLTFLVTALCLFTKRTTFGVLILFPITLNIILYHLRFDIPGIGGGAVLFVLQIVLMWTHRDQLMSLLKTS